MGLVLWRANAARHHPQVSALGKVSSLGSFGSAPVSAQTGRLHHQFVRTQPVYPWKNTRSLIGNNKQWSGTISAVPTTTAAGIREHYDVGTETDVLYLVPSLAGVAAIGSKITSATIRSLPILTASAVIYRQGTGTVTLRPVLNGSAHTETGGNKSATGFLNQPRTLTGAGTLKHLAPGSILLRPVQTLTTAALLHKTGTGNLTLSPVLTGNSRVTERGRFTLEPQLQGVGSIRVQSGLWVVIPEDSRGWTVQ